MFEIIKKSPEYLEVKISNSNELKNHLNNSMCNALRRIIISEVETYSIEIVSFTNNTSSLIDGIISHRMGLIPIKVLDEKYIEDNINNFVISLNVKCDSRKKDIYNIHNIYSRDLEYDRTKIYIDENILLLKLSEGQSIHIECLLKKGCGSEHSKWTPACTTFIENDDKSYLFKIESIGQLEPIDIFIKSMDILKNKISSIK